MSSNALTSVLQNVSLPLTVKNAEYDGGPSNRTKDDLTTSKLSFIDK